MLYKMGLVSDLLDHIGRIYSPLNMANMKIHYSKTKFIRNPDNRIGHRDNKGVLNLMRNPKLVHILVNSFMAMFRTNLDASPHH